MIKKRYFLFHKPYDVLCQFTDQAGRKTLKEYVPIPGIYACGRLDYDSEGLLLLTDDGALIHSLTHPGSKAAKTYVVQVEGRPEARALRDLEAGLVIEGRKTLPARAEWYAAGESWPPRVPPIRTRLHQPTSWLEIHLIEGRNRQVRKMTAAIGHPTLRLIRTAIGPFELGPLPSGKAIQLSAAAVAKKMAQVSFPTHPA